MAQMNLSTEQKQTHRHGEGTCGCYVEGEWVGLSGILGWGDANYCTSNGEAMRYYLYITVNYIQSLLIQHDGRKYEKKNVCTAEIDTSWYINCNLIFFN